MWIERIQRRQRTKSRLRHKAGRKKKASWFPDLPRMRMGRTRWIQLKSPFDLAAHQKGTPKRLHLQGAPLTPVELPVLGASTNHGTGQSYVSGESQIPMLSFFPPCPQTLFPPLPTSSPKSAPVCGSPATLARVASRSCPAWLQRAAGDGEVSDETGRHGRSQRFRDSRCGSPGPLPSRWSQATKE